MLCDADAGVRAAGIQHGMHASSSAMHIKLMRIRRIAVHSMLLFASVQAGSSTGCLKLLSSSARRLAHMQARAASNYGSVPDPPLSSEDYEAFKSSWEPPRLNTRSLAVAAVPSPSSRAGTSSSHSMAGGACGLPHCSSLALRQCSRRSFFAPTRCMPPSSSYACVCAATSSQQLRSSFSFK